MTKLTEITKHLNGQLKGADAPFQFVSTDTRTLKPGELFIALKGENFDGHDHIKEAQAKGAVAVLVSKPVDATIPIIQVQDTLKALGQLAALRRSQITIPLIALTGSSGKTTVKEMMRSILTECGEVLANQGTLNNDIGVPLTLLKLNEQHKYAVIEMGANHPGEIAYLTQLARPTVAFINNVAPAHLEGFGSVEGVARAKSEIFQGLPAQGIALINADDAFSDWLQDLLKDRPQMRFGIKNKADFSARDLQADDKGRFKFILETPVGHCEIQLQVLGQHNVLNAVAAAAATQAVGASLPAIKKGLENMRPVAGRLVPRDGINGAQIFDDTYNANPASVKAALQVLAQYPGDRIFVMGDMRELGERSEELHREIGQFAKTLGIQQLFACGQFSVAAVKAFGQGGQHFIGQTELSAAVRHVLQATTTVLVKGSRGAKMENVVRELIK